MPRRDLAPRVESAGVVACRRHRVGQFNIWKCSEIMSSWTRGKTVAEDAMKIELEERHILPLPTRASSTDVVGVQPDID